MARFEVHRLERGARFDRMAVGTGRRFDAVVVDRQGGLLDREVCVAPYEMAVQLAAILEFAKDDGLNTYA